MSVTEFKKGDYIVLTKGRESLKGNIMLNIVYKQRHNSSFISMECDSNGSSTNGWGVHTFNKSRENDWRYATDIEILNYDHNNGPVPASLDSTEPYITFTKLKPEAKKAFIKKTIELLFTQPDLYRHIISKY